VEFKRYFEVTAPTNKSLYVIDWESEKHNYFGSVKTDRLDHKVS
jgi:hypothetical protein